MSIYRQPRDQLTRAAPETGPVADMVRQFADPHAFLRELVQNSLDAGATSIEVRAELSQNDQASFTVVDDGCGMDRDTIEGPLLTLFRSSKEGDDSKIGRYGVGFVSVFAIAPEQVVVTTSQGALTWVVRLYPDHSYELEERSSEGSQHGTSVCLTKRTPLPVFRRHAQDCEAALLRWCRHAPCPIRFSLIEWESGTNNTRRIDRPFAIRSAIAVSSRDGDEQVWVGPSAGASLLEPAEPGQSDGGDNEDFIGFYNRGLTLLETSDVPPELQGLRCKLVSPHLQHTISRDDVRRDEAFARLVKRARELAKDAIPRELAARLQAQAQRAASGAPAPGYPALLAAAAHRSRGLDPDRISVALTDPIEGSSTLRVAELVRAGRKGRVLVAAAPSVLTRALADSAIPVLRCAGEPLSSLLAFAVRPGALCRVSQAFVLATALDPGEVSASDERFCARVLRSLQALRCSVHRVALAHCQGAAGAMAFAGQGHNPSVCDIQPPACWWNALHASSTLWLDIAHPTVQLARARAAADPDAAGSLMARILVLRARGVLDARSHDRLLATMQESEP